MSIPISLSSLPGTMVNLFKLGAWAWAAPIAYCAQLGIASAGPITDIIFLLRYPGRHGKPLQPDEKTLIAEWKAIRTDVSRILDAINLAPAPFGSGPLWFQYARAELQRWNVIKESDTRADEQYFQASPYFGGKSHEDGYVPKGSLAWCAAFVNWCLHRAGYSHTGSASDDSFLKSSLWSFNALEAPKEGCIIVIGHDIQGTSPNHVAFLARSEHLPTGPKLSSVAVTGARRLYLLGGNQDNTVKEKNFWSVKMYAAKGLNGVTSPYLWPTQGPVGQSCKIHSVPTNGAHHCGINPTGS